MNKYKKWYDAIIDHAHRNPPIGYTEKHHIVPRSIGGSNDPSNLVVLSARQHFICHLLLVKFTKGKEKAKMAYAAWQQGRSLHLKGERLTSHQYAQLRKELSQSLKGVPKKPFSDDARKRMSEAHMGLPGPKHSDKTKAIISAKKKGRQTGENNPFFNKTHSDQFKQEQSLRSKEMHTGKEKIKYSCVYCKKVLSIQAINTHNIDKCKIKSSRSPK